MDTTTRNIWLSKALLSVDLALLIYSNQGLAFDQLPLYIRVFLILAQIPLLSFYWYSGLETQRKSILLKQFKEQTLWYMTIYFF